MFKRIFKGSHSKQNARARPPLPPLGPDGLATYRPTGENYDNLSTSGPYGLECLYHPGANRAELDVVFVHGLFGNRENTWTHKAENVLWPRELLPTDMPAARILTYGYDADVGHFYAPTGQNKIGQHAANLLQFLSGNRNRDQGATERPVVFVAHSLGRLVVEDMPCRSRIAPEDHLKKIWTCTRGVVFLGTPHCGSNWVNWMDILGRLAKAMNRSNSRLINVLRPASEVLGRIEDDFASSLRVATRTTGIEIVCFSEELPMPLIGKVVVPSDSAIIRGHPNATIRGNHIEMAKFASRRDGGYQIVVNELLRLNNRMASQNQTSVPPETTSQPYLQGPYQQRSPSPRYQQPRDYQYENRPEQWRPVQGSTYISGTFSGVGPVMQGNTISGGTFNYSS